MAKMNDIRFLARETAKEVSGFVLRSQASSCNVFPTLRMEIAEPPTADLECNMIVV
ncbi:hypothetical protein H6B11_16615 [Mediterraneibacter glycyrrhizinilyticus]|nr:hypothetical protein [Mediterraneibacter glycyrrhizinilyticus]MBM6855739.1 hypothetical protein [Mediterraneibacter glycyrrhizinilyticus]